MFIIIWWHLLLHKKNCAIVKDLNPQCEVEGFKFSHLQISCDKVLGCLTSLSQGSYG